MSDLIVSLPDHCLFFYFSVVVHEVELAIKRVLYGLL